MQYARTIVVTSFVLSVVSAPIVAQNGRGNGGANKPQTPAHATGKPADTPKGNATGNPHTAPSTPVVTMTTPVSVKNQALEQRLQVLLPGMNVTDASRGFKNWGQFVAAAHVSHNLNIPFADLKAKMTGPTPMSLGQAIQTLKPAGTTTLTASTVKTEVRKAESETDEDFRAARNDRER